VEIQAPKFILVSTVATKVDPLAPRVDVGGVLCVPIGERSVRTTIGSIAFSYMSLEIDLAFAMTIHKAQGKTLDKVVLCLDSVKPTFEMLLVALTRVRRTEDLRMMPSIDGGGFSHLDSIQQLDVIRNWLGGTFGADGRRIYVDQGKDLWIEVQKATPKPQPKQSAPKKAPPKKAAPKEVAKPSAKKTLFRAPAPKADAEQKKQEEINVEELVEDVGPEVFDFIQRERTIEEYRCELRTVGQYITSSVIWQILEYLWPANAHTRMRTQHELANELREAALPGALPVRPFVCPQISGHHFWAVWWDGTVLWYKNSHNGCEKHVAKEMAKLRGEVGATDVRRLPCQHQTETECGLHTIKNCLGFVNSDWIVDRQGALQIYEGLPH
jgi:hypothetical protein